MELWQLRYLVMAAEERHFGRAAARLNVSQPSVTRAIQSLEAELGVTLLDRGKRQVEPTEAGVVFVAEARRILQDLARSADLARRAAAGEAGTLVIGFEGSFVLAALPTLIGNLRRRFPALQVTLHEMASSDQVKALQGGDIDLGFAASCPHDHTLRSVTVIREPLVAAVATEHPLAGRPVVPLADLAGEPIITSSHNGACGLHTQVAAVLRRSGVDLQAALDINDSQLLLAFVGAGAGIALVPRSIARQAPIGVTLVPIEPETTVRFVLMWRSGKTRPAVIRFRDHLCADLNLTPEGDDG